MYVMYAFTLCGLPSLLRSSDPRVPLGEIVVPGVG